MSDIPTGADQVAAVHARFDTDRVAELGASLTPELLADYAKDPDGDHPEPLARLLRFLSRRRPADRLAVYESSARREWRLVRPPAHRGAPYRIADARVFDDLDEARTACLHRELFEVFGWGEDPAEHAVDGPPVPADEPVLLGYADRVSVAPGERITFMISAEGVERYTTELVRLRHGDDSPSGPGVREQRVESEWTGRCPGVRQATQVGSHISIEDSGGALAGVDGVSIVAFVLATRRTGGRQAIVARWDPDGPRGYALGLDEEGRPAFWVGTGAGEVAARLSDPLPLEVWHAVGASYDPRTGQTVLVARPVVTSTNSLLSPVVVGAGLAAVESGGPGMVPAGSDVLLLGALTPTDAHYNGKIEDPAVWPRALSRRELTTAVSEDPAAPAAPYRWWLGPPEGEPAAASLTVECAGHPELAGRLVNLPVQGVTGRHWTGRRDHYAEDPAGYGAVHLHDDALADSNWRPTQVFTVPRGLPSGVYALRVADVDGPAERNIPFVVRPPSGTATAELALLLPTATYLAYANERGLGYVPVVQPGNAFLERRYDLGHSVYATHSDGAGCCYASWSRPILTLDPGFKVHLSPAWLTTDLYIVDWLAEQGYQFDVITDHDLHAEGAGLLGRYRAVVTGAHPEYASAQMLDAIEGYLDGGGNLGYLGGNGFYWVVSFHPELPHVMELRRAESGTRTWQARPGEYYHATTGERGGLWRMRGRPPQKVFGVGFTAQGSGPAGHYRTGPGEAARLLDGVGEVFGDAAMVDGGAAGNEVDRYDPALGSPPDAVVLATSTGLGDRYQLAVEELTGTHPGLGGTEHPDVRSDIVYFRTRGGGSVFATGSISFSHGLSANGYRNGISRLTRNVLDGWLAPE
ncbi:N,N-dimethylformamidase beta subunit family domain-containing protein [Pseudonocardia acaciae]|uniref:N,N-dimethylformamidase beta subunit family domain-containing protein n=1 Tax=Pseudonocardia acaciae TaxID=551276 RepID=UPI000688097C|nr:N,N-dimethylformamidase beta subunit family domain-containing protein [Pseudonocardia acaciae]